MDALDVRDASKLLLDDYALRILVAAQHAPHSTQELSTRHDIPIAVCYRRVATLESMGLLLHVDRVLTQKGKWVRRYRSLLRGAYFFLERGKVFIRFDLEDRSVVGSSQWKVLDPLTPGSMEDAPTFPTTQMPIGLGLPTQRRPVLVP